MIEKDGLKQQVKLVPELKASNLFLITQALDKGFQLSSEGKVMVLKKGRMQVRFDHIIMTKSGWIAGVKIIPKDNSETRKLPRIKPGPTINVNGLHNVF